nr:WD repeat-containing protein 43-like [Ipomoea trifida]
MAKKKQRPLLLSFTPDGNYLALLSPDGGTITVWNTSDGSLFAEWRKSDENSGDSFSCMACCLAGKKRKKERRNCLVVLGTENGDVLAIDISAGAMKWRSTGTFPGGTSSLFFTNNCSRLCAIGSNGVAFEMNLASGEHITEIRLSKKSISSSAHSSDERTVAVVSDKVRILSMETGKQLVKFSSDLAPVHRISLSDGAKFIVISGNGGEQLQVCKADFSGAIVSSGPILSMKDSPIIFECKNRGEDGLVVLSLSEAGVCYIWNLKSAADKIVNATKITVKGKKGQLDQQRSGKAKKSHVPIIAARLDLLEENEQLHVRIAFGSIDSPQFTMVDIATPGEDIVIAADNQSVNMIAAQERGIHGEESVFEGNSSPANGVEYNDDLNEPTMGEKLASLNLVDENEAKANGPLVPSAETKPPSADSVHVLLKQALHADDRALLIDCLFRQDEKVIANSVSLLNPSDVIKLLQSLVSIIESRGAILACALPWLRSVLLQHSSGIMSQESSFLALNSLYQLIESRVSTSSQALQLASSLDLLYAGTIDYGTDEDGGAVVPAIYEDMDESEEEEGSEVAMETESDAEKKEPQVFSDVSDFEGIEEEM